jgi:hypothetical protein
MLLAACGAPPRPPDLTQPATALVPTSAEAVCRIEVRQIAERPRLTLVSREGDPKPAVVVTVATDLPPVATTALSAVVEERLKRSGFDLTTRVDRSAFRLEWLAGDAARLEGFFAAVALAFSQPITAGSPELAAASQRLVSLRRNPLDAPEIIPIAACTGRLGIAGNEPVADVASAAGARDAEQWRRSALHAARTSVAAVGTAPFCMAAARALETTDGWAAGAPVTDAWPAADTAGTYLLAGSRPGTARLSLAVRVGDVHAAIAAAERLGAPDSALRARLPNLPHPFRAVEIAGVARPRGGCVSVTLETASPVRGQSSLESAAALAAAVVHQEIRLELAGPSSTGVATRQILSATDSREAASRAAWWALAGSVAGMPPRSAIALGYPAGAEQQAGGRARFEAELGRALAMTSVPITERRMAVERGQGEFWLLLASPCGAAEEGSYDAGATALAALAVAGAHRTGDVSLEPWIAADGIGVIAHAPLLDHGETPAALARRVAAAAARTIAATALSAESIAAARAFALEHLELTMGRQGRAFEQFTSAVVRDHPSWLEPFGVWSQVAGEGLQTARLRWQAVANGPIRLAVLANADDAQAVLAAEAVDRWFIPRDKQRSCQGSEPSPSRPGRYEVRLPSGTPLAQAMIGVPVAPVGAPDHAWAELTALALGGKGGLLESALGTAHPGAIASARILGGARAAAILIDVRVPPADLAPVVTNLRALLTRLAQSGPTDADLSRALAASAQHAQKARTTSRHRLIELWQKPPSPALDKSPTPPTRPAWAAWMAGALREPSLIVVEARPE